MEVWGGTGGEPVSALTTCYWDARTGDRGLFWQPRVAYRRTVRKQYFKPAAQIHKEQKFKVDPPEARVLFLVV